MAEQPPVVVRKTKKSSYKPLSKLNEDKLADLTRMERPEYTKRVFYCSISSKARLRHDVNVWFRDHQHSLTLINRRQRAVYQMMGRLQKDVRRVKRDDYKRRQQDIRDRIHSLHLKLLQRRVIQNFRRNAALKMAARGEKSLSEAKLSNQDSDDIDRVMSENTKFTRKRNSVSNVAATVFQGRRHSDHQKRREGITQESFHPHISYKQETKGGQGGSQIAKQNKRETSNDSARSQTKSVRRYSESDVHRLNKEAESARGKYPSPKLSVFMRQDALDVIPETATSDLMTPVDEKTTDQGQHAEHSDSNSRDNSCRDGTETVNSRVLEVRKNRPHSPSTRTVIGKRRATLGNLLQTDNMKSSSSSANTPPHPTRPVNQDSSSDKGRPKQKSNSSPLTSLLNTEESDHLKETSEASRKSANDIKCVTRTKDTVECDITKHETGSRFQSHENNVQADFVTRNGDPAASKIVTFGNVPDRDKALQDAATILTMDEGSVKGEKLQSDRKKSSLAARMRLQRQQNSKRRSEMLDKEPLVQYYRSVRGTLEPLLTEPSRRSFPPPSGRPQYEQNKLLREEQQKDLARRQDINKFFNDLYIARQMGTEQIQPPPAEDKAVVKPASKARGMLMNRLRHTELGVMDLAKRNSIEQLSNCQYLRVYDWDARNKERDKEPVETSWSTAENQLKAGFLALSFS